MPSTKSPQGTPASPTSALARFQDALASALAGAPGAEEDLVAALREVDAAGDAGDATAALRLLNEHPQTVLRLDEAVRRTQPYDHHGHPASSGRPVPPPLTADTNPVGVALASAHTDGRVRDRAVRLLDELLSGPQPPIELVPFLVVRTCDWARPVRDRARAALAQLLHEAPGRAISAAAGIAVLMDRRRRGGFAGRQVLAALLSLPGPTVIEELLAAPDGRLRQLALQAGLAGHRLPIRTLVQHAESDSDQRTRAIAADAAVREAVWTERHDLLRRLAASRHREVRGLALTGLMRAGRAAEVATHLDDPSGQVRAVAREAVRRSGGDALGHYRAAVRSEEPSPGAIAGLAESGRATDADLLLALLEHPRAQVRAAALHGLRAFDVVPVQRVAPLLRDPSTKVIREATAALRTRVDQLPAGLGHSLLADRDRVAVRRAGYRLLREPDLMQRLLIALAVAADPDPRLAGQAAADAAALIRSVHTTPWRTRVVPAFDPTPEQRRDLLDLARTAGTALPHRALQLLQERLDPEAPATELLRIRYGPHPDTSNPLLEVRATFTAQEPYAAIVRIREVLAAILPLAAGPVEDWPADDQWPGILPDWFVRRCAPEAPARQSTPADWLSWWRGLTQQQREFETRTDAVADWRLSDWVSLFEPDGAAAVRSWRWWSGGISSHSKGWIRIGTDGHPYGGRGALHWLIEAAGGYDIELP
jgi:hypothetical protein